MVVEQEFQLSVSGPAFSVLIVNFNGGDYVQGALASLARQSYRNFEVILVDNASTDGSVDKLDIAGLPNFMLLSQTKNLCFAGGNNLGAHSARGRWLALLNPDAEAAPDWLEKVAEGAARHSGVTSFSCTQYALHAPDKLDGAGDNYLVCGIPWRGGYGRPACELPGEGEAFSPCGASAIYDRSVFLAHGGFDERLFCFGEDVDLGFRLRLVGERCIFLPSAIVFHAGGGLSNKVSGFAVRLGTRNRLWVYLKNMPMALLIPTLPFHVALTLAILARGLFTGRFSDAFSGLVEGVLRAPYGTSGRRQLQAERKISIATLAAAMDWNLMLLLSRKTSIKRPRPELTP
jgi:N-acetylglucosaminyl-diphospho-decaprenol L-rhamnosyltransferase